MYGLASAPDWHDLAEAAIPPGSPITHAIAIPRRQRLARRATAWGVVALAAGLTAAHATAAPAAAPAPRWQLKLATRYLPPATNRSQYDAVVVQGQVSWFFGGSDVGGTRSVPKIERRQHGRWHSALLPAGLHSWIAAASAPSASDIWAVTALNGKVLHWNGARWIAVNRGRWSTRARFTGIVALSPSNVWLFGTKGTRHPGAGTWHLLGGTWTRVRGLATNADQASAASAAILWAIGGRSDTSLLRFSHSAWQHETPAALAGFTYSDVLALGPSNVWAAGSVAGVPELGHFNGHSWTALTMPGAISATAMCRDGRGGLWVIANPGSGPSAVLDRSAAGHWSTAMVSATSANEVLACAHVTGRDATWGAGKAVAPKGTAAAAYGFGDTP